MKKLILLLIIIPSIFYGQSEIKFYPDPEDLQGADIQYIEGSWPAFKIYATFDDAAKFQSKNILWPDKIYKSITIDSMLLGKYLIKNITQIETYKVVELYSYKHGISIFYKHSNDLFPFEKIEIVPEENTDPCLTIEKEHDDFEDEDIVRAFYYANSFYKYTKGKTNRYYLGLSSTGYTYNVLVRGLKVIFEDGTKYNKPTAKVNISTIRSNYTYSVDFELTQSELALFKKKRIKKYRIYIYDRELDHEEAEGFRKIINCVINDK